jgi:hypothetical protein
MDIDRITHPLRLAKGSHQPGSGKGCAMNVISHINGAGGARRVGIVGVAVLAVMALGADPAANANPSSFLAAVQAAGITDPSEPEELEEGDDVCDKIWERHIPADQVVALLTQRNPALTTDKATLFVIAAYQNLCPAAGAPGAYDWWAYGQTIG